MLKCLWVNNICITLSSILLSLLCSLNPVTQWMTHDRPLILTILPVGMETCDSVMKGIPVKKYISLKPHDYLEGILFFI
jgi:hypothetical protein